MDVEAIELFNREHDKCQQLEAENKRLREALELLHRGLKTWVIVIEQALKEGE